MPHRATPLQTATLLRLRPERRDAGRTGHATQQRILRETLQLIAERGYRATTLKVVANAAGITEPAIYRHYAGRTDLIASAFAAAMDSIPQMVKAGSRACSSPLDELAMVVTALLEPNQHLIRRTLVEMNIAAALEPEMAAIIQSYTGAHVRGIRERIDRAVLEGELDPQTDAAHAAWFVYVLIMGLAHLETIDRGLIGNAAFAGWLRTTLTAVLHMPALAPAPRRRVRRPRADAGAPAAPATRPSTRSGAHTRRRILDVAMNLIATRGYHATTMKMVGEAVGVSEPAVYRYFPGKADLMAQAFRNTAVLSALGSFATRTEWHDDLLPDYFAAMASPANVLVRRFGVELHSVAPFNADVTRITHEHNRRNFPLMRALLLDGVARGRLPADYDVEIGQRGVHTLMMGICHQETINAHLGDDPDWNTYLRNAMRAALPLVGR